MRAGGVGRLAALRGVEGGRGPQSDNKRQSDHPIDNHFDAMRLLRAANRRLTDVGGSGRLAAI